MIKHNFGMVQLFLHEDETCVIKKSLMRCIHMHM